MSGRASVVVRYDPEWPRRFEAERALLEAVLAPWLSGGVHHVGSTAVPGLAAKPIIDMVAGVVDLAEARAAFEPLREVGYRHAEHRPEAHSLHKPAAGEWWEKTHHLHLTEPGSDLWRERLAFRDALRVDPSLADEYADWKMRHAAAPGEPKPYNGDKRPFVARVLADAGIELKPDSERLSASVLRRRNR
jgi:GrpB-like predicted nucleotidyltransferase (UPF0157 family)